MKHVWLSEWKMVTRQKSYYSLIVLWMLVFSLLFLLQGNYGGVAGYTNITATIVNIILYLLPLFMLITGSFSISGEIENGKWHLLATYPVNIPSYLFGKVIGLFISQWVIFTFSFGISMALGLLFQIPFSGNLLLGIYAFSILLILIFLLMGILFGSMVSTRWKALMISVSIWFFLIMIWPTALIAILGLFPYPMISPLMKLALFINPAEFLRFFFVARWGSGTVFGEAYYSLVELFASSNSWIILIEYFIAYVSITLFLSFILLKRRQMK
ncbi:ABC transporter permease [Fervidibacillus halotolerans]|uniref:ABC transporter permease n=1 Tax=Fervidibacillus halotolerans TaxID=2980027 RepID=A0A9E8M090_9BACI|nr:ABC transporter permease subunit [Fervidibacillus halotolerans]WAA12985.1 ABC transporter permease [Fervidibacillus halotolerans]